MDGSERLPWKAIARIARYEQPGRNESAAQAMEAAESVVDVVCRKGNESRASVPI